MKRKKKNKNLNMLWNIHYIKTTETYYLSCNKSTANKSSSVRKTKQVDQCLYQIVLFVTRKKSRFKKNQGASRLELR